MGLCPYNRCLINLFLQMTGFSKNHGTRFRRNWTLATALLSVPLRRLDGAPANRAPLFAPRSYTFALTVRGPYASLAHGETSKYAPSLKVKAADKLIALSAHARPEILKHARRARCSWSHLLGPTLLLFGQPYSSAFVSRTT